LYENYVTTKIASEVGVTKSTLSKFGLTLAARMSRAVQLLLGHTKTDSTVRYLGVDLENALAVSESVDV